MNERRTAMRRLTGLLIAGGFLLGGGSLARAADAPDKEGVEFFEAKIRPVLAESCWQCHSVEAKANKKLKAKLFLDSWEGMNKGGDSEKPAVVAGKPDESALIKSIRYQYKDDDEDLNMPPKQRGKGGKLPDDVVKNFEAWVKRGAPHPAEFDKPPAAKAEAPQAQPDAKAATADAGHKPHWAFAAPKDAAVPAVKDAARILCPIDNFVQSKLEASGIAPSPAADRRTLIRRATFDLTGLPPTPEEVEAFTNDPSPDAFEKVVDRLLASPRYGERWGRHWLDIARYADTKGYVFNEERRYPYAFTYRDWVIESFNGDLPYDQFLIRQLAADKLDLGGDQRPLAAMGFLTVGRRFLNNQNDIIDDRIDTLCRGTMALTVACARCHDHKFDPIPTKDYYALYGVFSSSVEPKDLPLLVAKPEVTPGSIAYEKELKVREGAIESFLQKESAAILDKMRTPAGIADYLIAATKPAGNDGSGQGAGELSRYMAQRWRNYVGGKSAVFGPFNEFAALPAGEFAAKATDVTERLASKAKAGEVNPLVAEALAGAPPASLRDVAERYGKLLVRFDKADALSDASEEALRQVLRGADSPLTVAPAERAMLFQRDRRDKLTALQQKLDAWPATSPDAPARAMVLRDAPRPGDAAVLVRGNPANRGPVAPRQFLEVLSGPNRQKFTQGSGRLELAKAIASKDNPLTARVFVNRVWGWHFGQGIVRTPSDFGTRADPPTHPELLDWLAVRFMEDGWSVKKLHKRILLSATYQQASEDNAAARKIDPENLLAWRYNRQRLDFEGTRDALVFVTGKLDETRGGRPVDIATAEVSRRSVYGFIDRQNLPGMFRAFDFASPDATSPQRFTTTVPQQALFFMNSPFARRQAKLVAERPDVKDLTDPAARVDRLYRVLYQREPSADERSSAMQFVETEMGDGGTGKKMDPWEKLAQVMMESNEFVFVD